MLWRIRNQRGVALTALGSYPEAIEDLEWCRQAGVELDDRAVQLHALANLGEVERRADEHGRAVERLEEAHRLARDLLDVESEMLAAGNLALTLAETGHPDRAAQLYEREAELAQRIGRVDREAAAAAGLAGLAFDDDPACQLTATSTPHGCWAIATPPSSSSTSRTHCWDGLRHGDGVASKARRSASSTLPSAWAESA